MNIFKKIKAEIVYSLAVRKADNAHSENGERYYVMPSEDGRLVVVDRRNFRILKRKTTYLKMRPLPICKGSVSIAPHTGTERARCLPTSSPLNIPHSSIGSPSVRFPALLSASVVQRLGSPAAVLVAARLPTTAVVAVLALSPVLVS